ncbi:hypothetical protein D3C75_1223880 [compost metagenome]
MVLQSAAATLGKLLNQVSEGRAGTYKVTFFRSALPASLHPAGNNFELLAGHKSFKFTVFLIKFIHQVISLPRSNNLSLG